MARICMATAMILSIIGVGLFSFFSIKNENEKISRMLDNIAYLSENDETQKAISASDALSGAWRKSYNKMYCFVNHNDLAEIDDLIPRLHMLIEGDSDETTAEIESIKEKMKRMYTKHRPTYRNIL
ncbi:MAG: DUF4363 family protein [Oscillospiraceae bacterium]|nr:DUF4363 family protein [Oscillospiraceae bacterium]